MTNNSLEAFIEGIRPAWGPLSSELIATCRARIEDLVRSSATEPWLAELLRTFQESKELYRDPVYGFLLLAHAEALGRYRPPHDHGRGWVIYAVQQGEMEVGTYIRVKDSNRRVRLVKREAHTVRAGEARVYLPGDIHDTRCTAGPVLYCRFTERDLKKEEAEGHGVTRYVKQNGVWTVGA